MDHNDNFDNLTPEQRAEATDKITRFGAILLALGIITYCFALAKLEEGFARFATSLFGCLMGGVGIFIIVVVLLAAKSDKSKHNFFLYDKKKKREISVSELSVGEIRGRLTDFMAAFKFRGKLYIGDLFDDKNRIPEHFKILFCYELLCEISENRADAEMFLSFGKECADIFTEYLTKNGDGELATKIRGYILDFSGGDKKTEEFRELIVSKKEALEERMLDYTVKNIEKFG